jgi:hypothetical protein
VISLAPVHYHRNSAARIITSGSSAKRQTNTIVRANHGCWHNRAMADADLMRLRPESEPKRALHSTSTYCRWSFRPISCPPEGIARQRKPCPPRLPRRAARGAPERGSRSANAHICKESSRDGQRVLVKQFRGHEIPSALTQPCAVHEVEY